MAKLVLAAGVPHPPRLVREMQDAPGQLRGEALFKQVAGYFEAAAPDVIIELDSDHFVQFFYSNVPAFCVGLAEEAEGPEEIWVPMPKYTVKGDVKMGRGLLGYGLKSNFDLAAAEELRLDHSMMVPPALSESQYGDSGHPSIRQRLCRSYAHGTANFLSGADGTKVR